MDQDNNQVIDRLISGGVHPSIQRIAIMQYLMTHFTHPTVKDVYDGLKDSVPTLSKTTVYNTLRLFAEHDVAQMITIDDHHICYDGNTAPHVHFYCKKCGKVTDLMEEDTRSVEHPFAVDGNIVDEVCLYYKGVCKNCQGNN